MSTEESTFLTSSVEPAGEPTDRKFRELTILDDVGHKKVPEVPQDEYHERTSDGGRTDTEIVTRALELGRNVVLKGQPGIGKSFLAQYIYVQTNRPLYRMTLSETTFREDLLGLLHLVNSDSGETVTKWIDGPLTRAARVGGVPLLDELYAADASCSTERNHGSKANSVADNPTNGRTDWTPIGVPRHRNTESRIPRNLRDK